MPNWLKYPVTLLVVGIVSAGLLAGIYKLTSPQKAKLSADERESAKKLLLPDAVSFEDKPNCSIGKNSAGTVVGYVATGESIGYGGPIGVMASADDSLAVKGVKILYHQETPGLGSKIEEIRSSKTWGSVVTGKKVPEEKPWFTAQFVGKTAPISVKNDGGRIDAITGATISSRAVCNGVNEALGKMQECLPVDVASGTAPQ